MFKNRKVELRVVKDTDSKEANDGSTSSNKFDVTAFADTLTKRLIVGFVIGFTATVALNVAAAIVLKALEVDIQE